MTDIKALIQNKNLKSILSKESYNINYSIMPLIITRIKEKELLHSDIITSLMKQSQCLSKSNILFKHFFNEIELDIKIDAQIIKIFNEYVIDNNRRIDIILTWENKAVIIENKLNNAKDQQNQINDYYNFVEIMGYKVLKVVYIPSIVTKHAPIGLDNVIKSKLVEIYPLNLINWLKNTLEEGLSDFNFEREIANYINILEHLEMTNRRFEENAELSNLLSTDDRILAAFKIHERWNDIKWHTEWEFWCDFELLLKETYKCEIHDLHKYSPDCITNAVHKSRNREYFYGIAFKIATTPDNNDLCVYIERGDEYIYFGLIIKNNDNKWIVGDNDYWREVNLLFKNATDTLQRINWIVVKYFTPPINFNTFNDEHTLLLKKENHRKKTIKLNIEQITSFLQSASRMLKIEFDSITLPF